MPYCTTCGVELAAAAPACENCGARRAPVATVTRYASWGERAAALLLDVLVLAIATVPINVFVINVAVRWDTDSFSWFLNPFWWLGLIAPALYYTLLHGGRTGQTVGKRVVGIRVVSLTGGTIGYGLAAARYVVTVALWWLFIPGLLDALWPLWDERSQALHDKVAKSEVVAA